VTTSTSTTETKRLKSGVLTRLDPRLITVEQGFNPRRFDTDAAQKSLLALKASIKEQGVLRDLWIRYDAGTDTHILVDGGRRLKAVKELIAEGVEILTVPVIQKTAANPADRLVLALTANEGEPLTQTEVGASYQRLVNYGWDVPRIAQRMGKTERYVKDSIELADVPDEIKLLVNTGKVTKSLAIKTVRTQGDKAAEALEVAVKVAKSEGKAVAKSAKKAPAVQTTAVYKLEQISIIMQEFEAMDTATLDFHKFAGILADISDVLESDVAIGRAA